MKIIINESQLRLIVENEDKDNLIDFTHVYKGGVPLGEWDDMFLHLNKKKGGKYDGYYIYENVNSRESDVTELKYLVEVRGYLNLYNSQFESLPMLKFVGDNLNLSNTSIESLPMLKFVGSNLFLRGVLIKSLPMLKYVGSNLNLYYSQIESLPKLEYVGSDLDLRNTPLSDATTEEELRKQINVEAGIYL